MKLVVIQLDITTILLAFNQPNFKVVLKGRVAATALGTRRNGRRG